MSCAPDFQALCERYDLSAVMAHHRAKLQQIPLAVYLYWGESDACVGGYGLTFEEAFANALTEMVERRPGYALTDPIITALDALAAQEVEPKQCERCQGNGEIVTDWDRYLHAQADDVADEAVTDCPNCDGYGVITDHGAAQGVATCPGAQLEAAE